MESKLSAFIVVLLVGASVIARPAVAQSQAGNESQPSGQAQTSSQQSHINVDELFAGNCGWCHADGGRKPGKGPQLMNTQRSDDFIRNRIKNGKEGAMPAFGNQLSNADIDAIIKYIHSLKPEGG